jgi:anti-sigma factor RsiW
MMKRASGRLEERLVAYLDGELDDPERSEIQALLARDPALRDRAAQLGKSAALVRAAFDDTLREEVPERLVAVARGARQRMAAATVVAFRGAKARPQVPLYRRWWIAAPAAASLFGLLVGGGIGYFGVGHPPAHPAGETVQVAATNAPLSATASWLDNLAGYHKLFVSATNDHPPVDFAPNGDSGELIKKISQRIAQQGMRVPNLKPWGLAFQGARLLVSEGRPAAQLFYTTDNKALGPITVFVGSSKRQNLAPTFDHREDVNLLYWRHNGRAYAIIGQANAGYLWGLANDIAWQMDAI